MQFRGAIHAIALVLAAGLAACRDASPPVPPTVSTDRDNPAAVLGGQGSGPQAGATLVDAAGRAIPPPRLPRNTTAQLVRSGPDTALAVWVQDDHVVTATYASGSGWSPAQPLEDIHGRASDPQIASNGQGVALALWRHTVGNIRSLRFSRFEAASGWSVPDVMPGALPRPAGEAAQAAAADQAPQLQMDAQGNAFAQWPSGFDSGEVQTARYVAGHGWTRALSEPFTAAAPGPAEAARQSVQ